MSRLKLERWSSSDNKIEHHFFRRVSGVEHYVIGFSPNALSVKARRLIMRTVRADLKRRKS